MASITTGMWLGQWIYKYKHIHVHYDCSWIEHCANEIYAPT